MSESNPIESEEINKITSVADKVISAQSSSQLKEILETSNSEENIITESINKRRRTRVIIYFAVFVFITSYIICYLLIQVSKRSGLIGKPLPIQIDDNSETMSIDELN
ncbi:hypothetical protein ENUP19_0111G0004 [Entamoeba nuttalli]|uniref:Uncharacterized protein n=2 Tax=Entamoeba nuttalli TaxID=412467 RepID=K2H1A9_ENTNP|nr:hypothetical protein ENU1_103500 [Entamoeba nuttalli P19]EKE40062.1 hypothetical protein ENU1_103500 [Entamoeba nuttalli P19]|eukprot:XP_008857602.1 hypothetical protein ENU1_103500 [Entamoeba nuttalli P19]